MFRQSLLDPNSNDQSEKNLFNPDFNYQNIEKSVMFSFVKNHSFKSTHLSSNHRLEYITSFSMTRHFSCNCSICHIICLCLYSIWNIQLQRNSLLLFTYALEVNHFTICVSSTKLHRLFGQLCRVRTFPLWYVTQQSLVKIVYFAMWKEWAFHCGTFEAFSSPFINSNCRHKQYYCLTECALLVKRSTTSHIA